MSDRPRHPEAIGDEVCIGNMFRVDFPAVGWRTKRAGTVCYDSDGNVMGPKSFCPAFVSRAEIEAAGVAIPATGTIDHRW